MSFLANLLAEFTAFVIRILATAAWRWLKIGVPTGDFWKFNPHDKVVVIAVSLPQSDPLKSTVNVPIGDTLAFGEIVGLLKHISPALDFKFHPNPQRPLLHKEWNSTIVLIGGGKSNVTTRCLLAALIPPLCSRDHLDPPQYDYKGLCREKEKESVLLGQTAKNGRLSNDYAYITRAPNPYYPGRFIYILVGGSTQGTYAAAHWVAQSKNLAWLYRKTITQRLSEFVRGSPRSDSVEVVLSVPVASHASELLLPVLDQLTVWHEDGGKNPYYFSSPVTSAYQKAYEEWADHFSTPGC